MTVPITDTSATLPTRREPRPVAPLTFRLVATLAGWAAAFVVVLLLLTVAGPWLESLPPALDALIFTGVLVPLMGNFVMPALTRLVGRYLVVRGPGA